jgi:hypothetical protein
MRPSLVLVAVFALTIQTSCPILALAQPVHRLTDPPPNYTDYWPTFSPRGDQVAFARIPDGGPTLPTIFVADLGTGAIDSLVTGLPDGWNPNGGLEWSPDGRTLAFYGPSPNGRSAVWIADLPGGGIPRIVGATEPFILAGTGEFDALATDGTIYRGDLNGSGPISVQIIGNLFGGPPPSPVISCGRGDSGGIMAVLANGDVWNWLGAQAQGLLVGNIFTGAGVSAVPVTTTNGNARIARPRPNPFNPSVEIPYAVASQAQVSISVFDATERTMRQPGAYVVQWNGHTDSGADAASGSYFFRIRIGAGSPLDYKVTLLR